MRGFGYGRPILGDMRYTFWHRRQLIGETDFDQEKGDGTPDHGEPSHLAGTFHPTDYGRRLLPRLCGIMTAGFELKEEMVRRGLPTEDLPPEIIEELFQTTAAGAHIIDIGRVLSEVELRDPGGVTLKVASMGFSEMAELLSLSRRFGANEAADLDEVPSAAACEVPEFLVSVTLQDLSPLCGEVMPLQ
jgi:hypothetical protein